MIVIGGGPAGLAVAGALRASGMGVRVLERATEVGAGWAGHYDRLHLHTVRWLSALPGRALPRSYGPWVARDDVVAYLRDYARGLDVELGVEVKAVERADAGWRVTTSTGEMTADRVVVATGYNRVPYLPLWAGRFAGELVHASRYRSGAAHRGKDVLVVGGGNTAAELAVDLVEQGASRVRLALRTPPNVVPRAVLGILMQALAILLGWLPPRVVDAIARVTSRVFLGDLARYGMPSPSRGVFSRALEGQIPILDVGLVAALRAGKIAISAAVEGFDDRDVLLADGVRIQPDVVVAATGYRRGLEALVGELGVLDARGLPLVHGGRTLPHAPGLHFIGYTNPLGGNLRAIARDACAIARAARA